MKNLGYFFSLFLLLGIASPLIAQDGRSTGQTSGDAIFPQSEITSMVNNWQDAYNNEDAKTLQTFFTDKAMMIDGEGNIVVSSREISGAYDAGFKNQDLQVAVNIDKISVSTDSGSANVTGTYSLNGKTNDGTIVKRTGTFDSDLVKVKNNWLISRHKAELDK